MADTKISDLTAADALDGTEEFAVNQGGVSKKATADQIQTLVGGLTHNFGAAVDPTAFEDSGDGYSVGSLWMRTDTGDVWRARAVGVGVAKWVKMGLSSHPGYVSGRFYIAPPAFPAPLQAGAALGTTTIKLVMINIEQRITISALATRVTTLFSGGLFGLAIYAMNPATKYPTGTPLASIMGASSTVATNVSTNLASNVTLEPGQYWVAALADNSTVALATYSTGSPIGSFTVGSATIGEVFASSTSGLAWLSAPGTYAGGFTDLSAASFTAGSNNACATLAFKIA